VKHFQYETCAGHLLYSTVIQKSHTEAGAPPLFPRISRSSGSWSTAINTPKPTQNKVVALRWLTFLTFNNCTVRPVVKTPVGYDGRYFIASLICYSTTTLLVYSSDNSKLIYSHVNTGYYRFSRHALHSDTDV
jgi:hypothetical protein